MSRGISTAGLARASARRPWFVVAFWVLTFVAAIAASAFWLSDGLTQEAVLLNEPEAVAGLDLLTARNIREEEPLTETIVIHAAGATVDDPEFRRVVEATTAELRKLQREGIVAADDPGQNRQLVNYYELSELAGPEAAAGLVSADRHATLIPVTLAGDLSLATDNIVTFIDEVQATGTGGVEVLTVGFVSVGETFNRISEEDLAKGEGIGAGIALIILIIVFGALVAAGVPLLLSVFSIAIAIGITSVLGRFVEFSFFVTNIITMIGLAVGIDYALFVIERYREERRHGLTKQDAIALAGGTASKAVLFSGITVVLALGGMFLVPSNIYRSLGAGAILVVIVAVAASLTLIPAVLSLLGDKIDWPRRRNYDRVAVAAADRFDEASLHKGFWGRAAHLVMTHPAVSALLAVGVLVAASLPLVDLNRGFAGTDTLPPSDVREAFGILDRDFSAGSIAPVDIVVDLPRAEAETGIDNLVAALAESDNFIPGGETVRWNPDETTALVTTTLSMPTDASGAYLAIEELRDEIIPATLGDQAGDVYVTGVTALNLDFFGVVDDYTPWVFVFVLGLSFLLLTLVFRSIVVPIKAILLNLLSVGAAYGLLVLVFQKGYGADFFGFQTTPTIEAWLPIFLFCILFGLSMDYHVFLLSRIREHYDQTGRNRESVAVGLLSTARIITGAALIMVAVFSGFASGSLVMFQQMGFGLAVAVLIDATIIRSILVPAGMVLLGDWNWYLPSWLTWMPDLRVEGKPIHVPVPAPPPIFQPEGAAD
ncbi:MAG: MMPL family transporter [Chloroflexia bacterium]|nr:MMPL family transporter [Chloroflexia bacterium]